MIAFISPHKTIYLKCTIIKVLKKTTTKKSTGNSEWINEWIGGVYTYYCMFTLCVKELEKKIFTVSSNKDVFVVVTNKDIEEALD